MLRGKGHAAKNAASKTCKRGHPLAGENLYLTSDGRRQCRTCMRDRDRRKKASPRGKQRNRDYARGERRKAYAKRYREEHRDQIRAYQREYARSQRAVP